MARADCPLCGGTGWKVVEQDSTAEVLPRAVVQGAKQVSGLLVNVVAMPCDCARADRTARTLARARVPRRYEHCDFENFETDLQREDPRAKDWNRSLEQAKLVVEGFARDYPAGTDTGLLLMGTYGTGKTHLAVAALKLLVLRGHDGLFYDYCQLLKEIQDSYNAVSQTTEMAVLEPVLSTELLLLDDLGASKPSAWALETVGLILKRRYNEKRITILTTHYLDSSPDPTDAPESSLSPPALRGKDAPRATFRQRRAELLPSGRAVPIFERETLGQRVGEHVRSRLYEMCRTVELVAPDYRKEIRQAGRVQP